MTDPYEQQLLAVFESCDVSGSGKLDCDGLMKLCDQLHLEDGRRQLMDCLLPAFTFEQFRDALLTLLAASRRPSEREPSPEREVSPKFVFGQKKYGRRSRPESTDLEDNDSKNYEVDDEDGDPFMPLECENISTEKKSCSLLIDSYENDRDTVITPTSVQAVVIQEKEEVESPRGQGEMELRTAWQRLGVGADGYLNPNELSLVCRAVGMEKMADEVVKQVFSKLDVDADGRIRFEEFLALFRSTHTTNSDMLRNSLPSYFQQQNLVSLDVNTSGYVSSESLVDLWEAGGVVNGSSLLLDLGVSSPQVSLTSVFSVLEEEVRSMATKSGNVSPQVNVLTAAFLLAQTQLKWTRSCLEQMTGERDKLHSDLLEANQRAALIAAEVDDRHARMERASKMQIKLLEQKHAEQVKQLSMQLASDRDQLTATTLRLEKRIASQQEEESRLRAELNRLQQDCVAIEKENQSLNEELASCEVFRTKAEKDSQLIHQLQQRVQELEGSTEQVQSLVEQLAILQTENNNLRDRNDELTIQVENLTSRPGCKRQNSGSGMVDGTSSAGTKRRESSWEQESPRLGKVRRYCTDTDISLDSVQLEGLAIGRTMRLSESGLEADLDTLDNSLTLSSPSVDKVIFNIGGGEETYLTEIEDLRATIAELQKANEEIKKKLAAKSDSSLCSKKMSESLQLQLENESASVKEEGKSVAVECYGVSKNTATFATETTEVQTSFENTADVNQLERHCNELRHTLDEVQQEILKILSEKEACNKENCVLKLRIQELSRRLPKTLNDDTLSLELVNPSGPLTYIIPNNVTNPDINLVSNRVENMNSPSNIALKCFPFFNKQGNPDSQYCLFPAKDVKDNGSFKFENLSQFAFEVSQSLSDTNFDTSPVADSGFKPLSPDPRESEKKEVSVSHKPCGEQISAIDHSEVECPALTELLKLTKDNEVLKEKCVELENALELMRVEYEKCEDYWQGKLNEERSIFDQEQKLSDEKFIELEAKIQEYAELFGIDDRRMNIRLPTIDEKDTLEKQVTDLEEEFEKFKKAAQMESQEKTKQIERLQAEVEGMHRQKQDCKDVGVQVKNLNCEFRLHQPKPKSNVNLKLCVPTIEVTGPGGADCCCPCHADTMSRRYMTRLRECRTRLQTECELLHRRREILLHQMTQLHQRTNLLYTPALGERRLASDVEMFHNLSSRLRHQELRCRHLQSALKHHQRETEKLLQSAWDQYRSDLNSVQKTLHTTQDKLLYQTKLCKQQMERLASSDVLVKDLYKENAQLTAQVLKLEEQNMFVDQSILGSTV